MRNGVVSWITAAALLVLGGCAHAGHVVSLAPAGEVEESGIGAGRQVAVRTVDERGDRSLGRLESRRDDPVPVTTNQDLPSVMTEAAREALRRKGFRPVAWSEEADRRLTIRLQRVEHVMGTSVPRDVTTRVELGFDAANGQRTLSGGTRTTKTDRILRWPREEDTAVFIDRTLDGALDNLFGYQLMDFLTNP